VTNIYMSHHFQVILYSEGFDRVGVTCKTYFKLLHLNKILEILGKMGEDEQLQF
jgi:hypothetical protein